MDAEGSNDSPSAQEPWPLYPSIIFNHTNSLRFNIVKLAQRTERRMLHLILSCTRYSAGLFSQTMVHFPIRSSLADFRLTSQLK